MCVYMGKGAPPTTHPPGQTLALAPNLPTHPPTHPPTQTKPWPLLLTCRPVLSLKECVKDAECRGLLQTKVEVRSSTHRPPHLPTHPPHPPTGRPAPPRNLPEMQRASQRVGHARRIPGAAGGDSGRGRKWGGGGRGGAVCPGGGFLYGEGGGRAGGQQQQRGEEVAVRQRDVSKGAKQRNRLGTEMWWYAVASFFLCVVRLGQGGGGGGCMPLAHGKATQGCKPWDVGGAVRTYSWWWPAQAQRPEGTTWRHTPLSVAP